jgi:hypothetical protein
MVHEGGGAFVALALAHHTAMIRVTSRFLVNEIRSVSNPFGEIASIEQITIRVEARSPGWHADTLLELPVRPHDLRLSGTLGVADRRGDVD